MKNKIYIIITIFCFLLTGCLKKESPTTVVSKYLDSYIKLDDFIIKEINRVIDENDEFNEEHKSIYKEILINQYKSLKYVVLDKEIDESSALVRVNITVNDLNIAEENAFNYVSKNLKNYYNDKNEFDNNKYITDKLNAMKNVNERKDYEIIFYLEKKNNEWFMHDPTDEDLEKIHGIYREK